MLAAMRFVMRLIAFGGTALVVMAVVNAQRPSSAPPPIAVTRVAARSIQPGEVALLTIAPFRVAPTTWNVLVGIDLETKPGSYVVTIVSGALRATRTLVVTPKAFPTRTLSVDSAFVNPPASEQARIDADNALLHATWSHPAADKLWTGPFERPVTQPANSAFGSRSVFNGEVRNPHTGADFLSPAGTPVKAPAAGRVAIARALYYSGNTVVIDHGLGLFSLFAHFSEIGVKEGDTVRSGDIVGKVGATGRVTGPHLHWAVRINDARVDPLSLLAVLGPARE